MAEQYLKVTKWDTTNDIRFGSAWQVVGEFSPINRLVILSPSTNMIVPTIFFNLILWQTNPQSYFILKVLDGGGRGLITLRQQYLKQFKYAQKND